MFILSLSVISVGCTPDENKNISSESSNYNKYLEDTKSAKTTGLNAVNSYLNLQNKASKKTKIEEYIIDYFDKNSDIQYLDFDYIYNEQLGPVELNLEEMGFSEDAINYYNSAVNLNNSGNYTGLISLMNQFKIDYETNSSLEGLTGIFTTIELYQDELLNAETSKGLLNYSCEPSGSAIASGAISGAIFGARVGWLFGSFLGPAGTAAGAAGGAIIGAIAGSIMAIGTSSTIGC